MPEETTNTAQVTLAHYASAYLCLLDGIAEQLENGPGDTHRAKCYRDTFNEAARRVEHARTFLGLD